eukprot:gene627-biopygen534
MAPEKQVGGVPDQLELAAQLPAQVLLLRQHRLGGQRGPGATTAPRRRGGWVQRIHVLKERHLEQPGSARSLAVRDCEDGLQHVHAGRRGLGRDHHVGPAERLAGVALAAVLYGVQEPVAEAAELAVRGAALEQGGQLEDRTRTAAALAGPKELVLEQPQRHDVAPLTPAHLLHVQRA